MQQWNDNYPDDIWAQHIEKEVQPQKQTEELEKQTAILSILKKLTHINVKCVEDINRLTSKNAESVKQIVEMTLENQKSSNKHFWASIIVSTIAVIIALIK